MAKRYGFCPHCFQETSLTRHHIYPEVHFHGSTNSPAIHWLCQKCHRELERWILTSESRTLGRELVKNQRYKLQKEAYLKILQNFTIHKFHEHLRRKSCQPFSVLSVMT